MSVSVPGGRVWGVYDPDSDEANDDYLRLELSWQTIAECLGQVLVSYALVAFCGVLSAGLALYLIANMKNGAIPSGPKGLEVSWVYHGGSGIIFLMYLFAYLKLLINKWRCAIHAPDRNGTKWYIFACCLCLVIGPIVGFAGGISISLYGEDVTPADVKAIQEFEDMEDGKKSSRLIAGIMQTAMITYVAGVAISMATLVCFVLFLRAIGTCFRDGALSSMAEYYIWFNVALICFTIYLVFFTDVRGLPIEVMIGFVLAWLGTVIWYVVLIFMARSTISRKLENLRSPLDVAPQ